MERSGDSGRTPTTAGSVRVGPEGAFIVTLKSSDTRKLRASGGAEKACFVVLENGKFLDRPEGEFRWLGTDRRPYDEAITVRKTRIPRTNFSLVKCSTCTALVFSHKMPVCTSDFCDMGDAAVDK